MNGTEKQIKWAKEVQATTIQKMREYCARIEQTGPEMDAAIRLFEAMDDASEWINRLRNRNALDAICNDTDDKMRAFRKANLADYKTARELIS